MAASTQNNWPRRGMADEAEPQRGSGPRAVLIGGGLIAAMLGWVIVRRQMRKK